MSPKALATHLNVAPSTLSAAIARLVELGYISSDPAQADKRHRELRLTEKGEDAMAGTSVLDGERVAMLLERLDIAERQTALKGLGLLARAARELEERK